MKIPEKIENNKLARILRNKKAVKMLSTAMLMVGVACGFGASILGKHELSFAHDVMMIWATVFILIFIGLFAWSMFFWDEEKKKT